MYLCIHLSFRSSFLIWGKMWPWTFWAWLTLLNMISSSSYLPVNNTILSFFVAE
jgi:hypothetical protein